jgi:hypothetical protein
MSWDSIIGLVTWLWDGQPLNSGLIPGMLRRILSSPKCSVFHAVSSSLGTEGSFQGVKWLGHEAEHSHLVPGLRLNRTIPPFPQCLHGMCKDIFTFTLPYIF